MGGEGRSGGTFSNALAQRSSWVWFYFYNRSLVLTHWSFIIISTQTFPQSLKDTPRTYISVSEPPLTLSWPHLTIKHWRAPWIVIQSKKITWQLFINSEKNHLPKEQILVILFLQFPLTDHRKALMPWRWAWLSWCEPRLHIMPKAFSACASCFYETIKPSAWSLSLYFYAVRPMKDLIFSTN